MGDQASKTFWRPRGFRMGRTCMSRRSSIDFLPQDWRLRPCVLVMICRLEYAQVLILQLNVMIPRFVCWGLDLSGLHRRQPLWAGNSILSHILVTGHSHKSERTGMGSLSCGILPSKAAVVKTWVPGAMVVDLCFVRCAFAALHCTTRVAKSP